LLTQSNFFSPYFLVNCNAVIAEIYYIIASAKERKKTKTNNLIFPVLSQKLKQQNKTKQIKTTKSTINIRACFRFYLPVFVGGKKTRSTHHITFFA